MPRPPDRATGDFTDQADAYARARPTYPDALLDDLIAHTAVRPGDPVADLVAGTGILSRLLADRGLRVTAVEPNDAMRRLASDHPAVTWQAGTFEATGLPDESHAWATAAQAFHWADPDRALPELHRVLRPGGYLTILWNNRLNDDDPLLARAWALIRRVVADFQDSYRENRDWPAVLTATGHFEHVAHHSARHTVLMSRDRFVDLWRSHHRLMTAAGPQRAARLLDDLRQLLDDADAAEVRVPYLCRAWTARRR